MDKSKSVQFGTFKGVFIPSILTILGVIMYLRMGWVVGQVGIIATIVIITLATAITFLTGLSISATATNMKVGGGGAYFMISRSFGVETGAAIGIPLFLAQALGISFYLAGFSESLHLFFPDVPLQILGIGSLIVIAVLAYISADLALKTQYVVFAVILISLLAFFFGKVPSGGLSQIGSVPNFGFWAVFAVFFPAVTGIEAGISMSGNLKDPARSLPRGTIAAVITGYIIYIFIAVVLWMRVSPAVLKTNPMVMKDIAFLGFAVVLGLWGASLSSAMGAMLGAPRTLQALSRDRVVPQFLGRGFGPEDTPRIATAFTCVIALVGILLGDLDAIAPVLSMFFLTSYGFLNLAAGFEGLIGNPSWRPSFHTPWVLSFLGAFACFATMLMINAGATFMATAAVFVVYYLMQRRHIKAHWADLRRSVLLFLARFSVYELAKYKEDARSWRPNMLVLSGSPQSRWYLIELAHAISHGKGFMTIATILPKKDVKEDRIENMKRSVSEFLANRNVQAMVEISTADNVMDGVRSLVQNHGIGPLVPNTIVLGETERVEKYTEFSSLIMSIYKSKRNVLIIREPRGMTKEAGSWDSRPEKRVIDVWWGRQRQNAGLMLAFAYMLETSPKWVGANLTLKSLVHSEEEKDAAYEFLQDFLSKGRLGAKLEVHVGKPEEEPLVTIGEHSKTADLVFIGMRPPGEDETEESFSAYYKSLLRRTEGFPLVAMVLAAENVAFDEIFQ